MRTHLALLLVIGTACGSAATPNGAPAADDGADAPAADGATGDAADAAAEDGADGDAPAPVAAEPAKPAEPPTLEPGLGWTDAPPEVTATALPIARFLEVPHRVLTEPEVVTVIALHKSEIERVEMSDNGGPWVECARISRDRWDGVFDPAAGEAGDHHIRARVVAKNGTQRTIQLRLVAREGDGWVTIDEPGGRVPREVRYVRVTGEYSEMIRRTRQAMALWLDDATFDGGGKSTSFKNRPFEAHWPETFVTGGVTQNCYKGPIGSTLVADHTIRHIESDALQNSDFVWNVTIDDIRPLPGSKSHPDVYQISGPRDSVVDNRIIYGVRATNCDSQGIFIDDIAYIRNMAFVDMHLRRSAERVRERPTGPPFSQWIVSADHVILRNIDLPTQRWVWKTGRISNFLLENFNPGVEAGEKKHGYPFSRANNVRRDGPPARDD